MLFKGKPSFGRLPAAATVYPHLFLIVHHNRTKKNNRTLIYTGLADEKRIYIPINWNGFEKSQIG
jgi:hypothetical protein